MDFLSTSCFAQCPCRCFCLDRNQERDRLSLLTLRDDIKRRKKKNVIIITIIHSPHARRHPSCSHASYRRSSHVSQLSRTRQIRCDVPADVSNSQQFHVFDICQFSTTVIRGCLAVNYADSCISSVLISICCTLRCVTSASTLRPQFTATISGKVTVSVCCVLSMKSNKMIKKLYIRSKVRH